MTRSIAAAAVLVCLPTAAARTEEPLPDRAAQALRRAVDFYRTKVAAHGGYVYRYSADLTKREGEGKTGPDTVWVQPPGTPAVGAAYLDAHALTREPALLEAARAAGECLLRGQLRSGGWTNAIEFAADARRRFAYRVDPPRQRQFNVTTFDDDKTQSAIRFLSRLDIALGQKDARVHEAVTFALDSVLKAQFPSGAWPQGYDSFPDPAQHPVRKAAYPDDWPRQHPGGRYWQHATLNDNNVSDLVETLLLAAKLYQEPRFRAAALRAGEFLILAQLPEPQPAWAQQYDGNMHPVWARKFEPPSITAGESQGAIRTLLRLYEETGDRKFLAPVPKALDYLQRSRLPDRRLARFYELKTNRPLYFTRQYELTYNDNDLPTHYAFKVASQLDELTRRHDRLAKMPPDELARLRDRPAERATVTPALERQVRAAIDALDERGAWVESGRLRYHGPDDDTRRVIDSRTFIRNVEMLSRYLAATRR